MEDNKFRFYNSINIRQILMYSNDIRQILMYSSVVYFSNFMSKTKSDFEKSLVRK